MVSQWLTCLQSRLQGLATFRLLILRLPVQQLGLVCETHLVNFLLHNLVLVLQYLHLQLLRLKTDLLSSTDRPRSFDQLVIALVIHDHVVLMLLVSLRIRRIARIVQYQLLHRSFGADASYLVLSRFELLKTAELLLLLQ